MSLSLILSVCMRVQLFRRFFISLFIQAALFPFSCLFSYFFFLMLCFRSISYLEFTKSTVAFVAPAQLLTGPNECVWSVAISRHECGSVVVGCSRINPRQECPASQSMMDLSLTCDRL